MNIALYSLPAIQEKDGGEVLYIYGFDGKCKGIYCGNDNANVYTENTDKKSQQAAASTLNMVKEIFGEKFPVPPKVEQAVKKIYGQE